MTGICFGPVIFIDRARSESSRHFHPMHHACEKGKKDG